MTVVAGVVDQVTGRVHLAADSESSASNDVVSLKPKLIQLPLGLDDQVIIGNAGYSFTLATIASKLRLDAAPDGTDQDSNAWAQTTAEAITELALEAGARDEGDHAHLFDGAMLLAWHDRLWDISHNLALPVPAYHAIGAGAPCAMGALWALRLDPNRALTARRAVEASIAHISGIRGPVQTMSTGGTDG